MICDGIDANAEMVRQGMAWVYVRYAPVGSPLFNLEAEARAARRGLWAEANAVAPWEWRRGQRTADEAPAATGEIRGNRRSMIYHLPHCSSYGDVSAGNRIVFKTETDARIAGYRRAGNCD